MACLVFTLDASLASSNMYTIEQNKIEFVADVIDEVIDYEVVQFCSSTSVEKLSLFCTVRNKLLYCS